MSELGSRARELIEAGRAAYRPSAGDRARVESALRARIGGEALAAHGAAVTGSSGVALPAVLGSALGLCLGAGVALWALVWHAPPQPMAAGPLLRVSSAPSTPVAITAPASVTPAPAPTATSEPAPSGKKPARPRVDALAQEVALLTRATRELAHGRPKGALRALDEHEQRFADGKLSEERRAAKARALCALGRVSEGRAEASQLADPSPAAERAKQACDRAARRNGI